MSMAGPSLEYCAKRAKDAWHGGACNPKALSRALVEAIDAGCERAGTNDLKGQDGGAPARMLLAQLCFIVGTDPDVSIGGISNSDEAALEQLDAKERS